MATEIAEIAGITAVDDEQARLRALHSLKILYTMPERSFDDLVQIATGICGTPIAALSLVDAERQWFKAKIGLDVNETPRDIAFCHHAIRKQSEIIIGEDASKDARFSANPLVLDDPNIRFYAGVPLVTDGGHAVGTVCVIDSKPRSLTSVQLDALRALGRRIVTQLKLRQMNLELNSRNDELSQFSYRVSHDFKAPLSTAKKLSELLLSDLKENEIEEAADNALRINRQMLKLESFVEDMLNLARADISDESVEVVNLAQLVDEILEEQNDRIARTGVCVDIDIEQSLGLRASRIRLQQILMNLVSNGLKYFNPEQSQPFLQIAAREVGARIELLISDNGVGIPAKFHHLVGQMFKRFHGSSVEGSGLGLAIVYKHAHAMGADISFKSNEHGTSFTLNIPLVED